MQARTAGNAGQRQRHPLRRKEPVLFLPRCGSPAAAQAVLPVSELQAGGHRHRGSQHETRHRFGKAKGKAVKERIADALSQVGLSGYERRKVYTLSGGEQQRVALAKIIAKSPDIILADEPTGGLDERNRSYVMDILKELNRQGKTIVVVTHAPYVSDCATRHIAL